MNKFSCITPHLFISNWRGSYNADELRDNEIELIVCLSKEKKDKRALKMYDSMRIHQIVIPLEDAPRENISAHFEQFYNMIHGAILEERNILVHCQTGTSTSAALVLFYLLKRYYITNFGKKEYLDQELIHPNMFKLMKIIEFVKGRRPCIEPNPGFISQILSAEMFLKKKLSAVYKAREAAAVAERRRLDSEEAKRREHNRIVKNSTKVRKTKQAIKNGGKKEPKKSVQFREPLDNYEESSALVDDNDSDSTEV